MIATAPEPLTDRHGGPTAAGPPPATEVAAEVGLLALALGTAASFNRLFVGWSFLSTLALPVVTAWASSMVMRRLRVGAGVAVLLSAALAVLVLGWRFAPGTTLAGVPTPETARVLGEEVRTSFAEFSSLVAPVPASRGFLFVIAAGLWIFGFFADTAAMRYRVPTQAAVPYVGTFVAAGLLARGPGRTAAAACFLSGVALYAVTQRALVVGRRRWIGGRTAAGVAAVAASAGAVSAAAVLAGVVLGPWLPGDTAAVVDLRDLGKGGGSRTVVSPFVGVRSLLGVRSDEVMFTVEADRAAYWRLTSLERYDAARGIWVSQGTYRRTGPRLAAGPTPTTGTPLDQRVTIEGLDTIWLPAAYVPRSVGGALEMSYDPESASLVARGDDAPRGTAYRVRSVIPELDVDAVDSPRAATDLDSVYREDPDLSEEMRDTAERVTAGATTPYDRAFMLQNWLRGFTYDESVDYSAETDAVGAFVAARRGFCQQFASTFALMARHLGLPSRVAVGFTPGDAGPVDPAQDDDAGTGFVVRGRHAHAWPEVYLDGAGWVPFEPTPGRGNPQATAFTGVTAEQAPPPQRSTTTTAAPTTTVPGATTPTTAPDPRVSTTGETTDEATGPGGLPVGPALVVGVLAAVAGAVVVGLRLRARHRRRERRRNDPHGGRVAAAWDDAVGWLALVGMAPRPEETPAEFARRAGEVVDPAAMDALAGAETERRFGAAGPTPERSRAAEEAAAEVEQQVRERVGRRELVRHALG